jgi:hypothetical protein
MKNTLDVSDLLFKALNVAGVKATIKGKVYKNRRPTAVNITEDIVIQPIVLVGTPINTTAVNLNLYFADLANGSPDEARMKPCINAVYAALDSFVSSSSYFAYDQVSENVLQDDIFNNWSFCNIRINVYTH